MKRALLILSVILILVISSLFFFLRTSSGFRSVYLIPSDAVLLVESKDPLTAWDNIIHSKAWEHLSSNELLNEINTKISSYDSLVNSSKFIMKLVGKKPVMLSQHPIGNGKYELLYIIELGKLGKYKKPEKILSSVLGDEFEITSRTYNEHTIAEILDTKAGAYYFLSLVEGKLVFSLEPKLVEASIDASKEMIVGRDRKFIDVYSKISSTGLLSIFINHRNLGPYLKTFSSEAKTEFSRNKHFLFSGIGFNINQEGLITIEGYSSVTDTVSDIYKHLFTEGNLELETADVIPLRLASLAKINFKDAHKYFHSTIKAIGEDEYKDYLENLNMIEKKFHISLEDNFFSWMDKEIVMLQTQPSNLGRNNELAAIFHASDSTKAADNLEFLWKQIKKNSPVKIKSVVYRNYQIDYIAFPGLLKVLFGKALSKIEKPYFTQIGNNVILSNHPQTIKNLIDDYLSGSTLSTSIDYYNFNKNFSSKTAIFTYFEPPVLYYNLKDVLSTATWQKLSQNKEYFTCFNQAGMQILLDDDLIHYTLKAIYKPEIAEWKKQYYNSYEISSLFSASKHTTQPIEAKAEVIKADTIPKIILHRLDDNRQEDYYNDGALYRVIEIKKGQKHGDFKEYHPNGEVKIKGSFEMDQPIGKWKYYSEEGKLIKTDKY